MSAGAVICRPGFRMEGMRLKMSICIEGEYFDLGQRPIFRKSFTLGGAEANARAFLIEDSCIGCGICAEKCPELCITPGSPSVIDQSHCLRCGICQEACPVQAIAKL